MGAYHDLYDAIIRGDDARLALLLKNGADPDAADDSYTSALHRAAEERRLGAATLLLDAGADPNFENDRGVTPLGYATSTERTEENPAEMIRLLVARKADPNLPDYDEGVPLHHAAKRLNGLVAELGVKALLEAGANPNAGTVVSWTPLHSTVVPGNVGAARLLLTAGADPLAGVTSALEWAREKGGAVFALLESPELEGALADPQGAGGKWGKNRP